MNRQDAVGLTAALLVLASCEPSSLKTVPSSEPQSAPVGAPATNAPVQKAEANALTEEHQLGGVRVGMYAAEVSLLGLPFEKEVEDQEGEDVIVYVVHWPGGGIARLTMLEGKVAEIRTTSPELETPRGASVGDVLGALMAIYPNGEVAYGFEEGPYYSFATNENGEVFAFDVSEIGMECAPNGSNCRGRGDSLQYKSVSLTIR